MKEILAVIFVLAAGFLSALGLATFLFDASAVEFHYFLMKLVIMVAFGVSVGLFLLRLFTWLRGE